MSNHDVPRHVSRYGLPQVHTRGYHELPNDWLLRNGTTYIEDRELGTRRARAAILMELGLPGSVYVYQGEELGLPEVATIPWDHLEDPVAFNTAPIQIEHRSGVGVLHVGGVAGVPQRLRQMRIGARASAGMLGEAERGAGAERPSSCRTAT